VVITVAVVELPAAELPAAELPAAGADVLAALLQADAATTEASGTMSLTGPGSRASSERIVVMVSSQAAVAALGA
jgi:hypothetical protein